MKASLSSSTSFPAVRASTSDAASESGANKRPRGRPRKVASEPDEGNRRRQLIDAAGHLFRMRGYAETSTRDIAAAAGMRSGSPFYHFESKSALLHVVMYEGMQEALRSQREMLNAVGEQAPAAEKLRVLIQHHFHVLLEPQSHFIPLMFSEWRYLTPEQRVGVGRVKDFYEGDWMPVLCSLWEEGRLRAPPQSARLLIFGALNWSIQWFRNDGDLTIDALASDAMHLFIGGA